MSVFHWCETRRVSTESGPNNVLGIQTKRTEVGSRPGKVRYKSCCPVFLEKFGSLIQEENRFRRLLEGIVSLIFDRVFLEVVDWGDRKVERRKRGVMSETERRDWGKSLCESPEIQSRNHTL